MAVSHPAGGTDLLEHLEWTCCSVAAGAAGSPGELSALDLNWMSAPVPGTAASAYRAGGHRLGIDEIDGEEWWWRGTFVQVGAPRAFRLRCDGIATIWDLFIDDERVANGTNMFLRSEVLIDLTPGTHEIYLCCHALEPILRERHPRPRWRSAVVAHQNYRWLHTSMLGRTPSWTVTPPPVGPWRPITITEVPAIDCVAQLVRATCDDMGPGGRITAEVTLAGGISTEEVRVEVRHRKDRRVVVIGSPFVADAAATSATGPDAPPVASKRPLSTLKFDLRIDDVERWWPHTHGPQPLYDVDLVVGTDAIALGAVGFRSIEIDRSDGGFQFLVNGVPIFIRGAAWFPLDPISFNAASEEKLATLQLACQANLNMVRIPGGSAYEDEYFYACCDEVGLLVWQDSMLAFVDPPQDAQFVAELEAELAQVLAPLGQHPSLAIFCGGQEIEAHAAMFGLSATARASSVLEQSVPSVAARFIPDTPYVTSSPVGGEPPFRLDTGISHYYGVGTYLRDLSDARTAGVRFMSEGMAFATPPEDETLLAEFGKASVVGHDPRWKQAIHHEAGRAFDLEDVRDFYVRELFGVDPLLSRYLDAEHHLDLGRAVVAEILTSVLTRWRSDASSCDGALLIALRDLVPGAGWGVIDALGRPKAPWYALRRIFAPTTAYVCDNGLDGFSLHVFNDTSESLTTSVEIALYAQSATALETELVETELPPHRQRSFDFAEIFEGFRDLTYAFRFGQLAVEAIQVTTTSGRHPAGHFVALPGGPRLERERAVGLSARAVRRETTWELAVATRDLAQYVAIDIPGFVPDDCWFHLAPGTERRLQLRSSGRRDTPTGFIRALNSREQVGVEIVN
jgi:beta-mannosidase